METIFDIKANAAPEVLAEWLKAETAGVNVSMINREVHLELLDGTLQAELRSLPRPRINLQKSDTEEAWTALLPGTVNRMPNHITFTMQCTFTYYGLVNDEWITRYQGPTLPVVIINFWPMAEGCSRVVGYCKRKEHVEYFGEYVKSIGAGIRQMFGDEVLITSDDALSMYADKITDSRKINVARLYVRGMTAEDIGREYNRDEKTIYRWVDEVRKTMGKDENGKWIIPYKKMN